MSSFEKLIKKSKSFPNSPGIYWFSKNGKRIYVGKAGSLKKRIASYFRAEDPRIKKMVQEADNVSFKKTNSVLEAVILEANAIKKYLPKYNIKEKDNRSFVYLIITKDEFPKVFIARGREVEKYISWPHKISRGGLCGHVFGPYQSYRILKTALQLARKIFPFSTCRPAGDLPKGDKPFDAAQGKPCFDYQIGLCPGICVGAISKKDYQKNIQNLLLFFRGEHKRLFKKIKKENPEKVFALQHINDVALIKNNFQFSILNSTTRRRSSVSGRIEGYDISHFGGKDPVGAMAVFSGGKADNSQYRLFKIKNMENRFANRDPIPVKQGSDPCFDDLAMLEEIIKRRFNHREWPMPDIVLIDGGKNQVAVAKRVLADRNIFIPIVGIAKVLGHSGRASEGDKLIFTNTKPSVKKLLISSRQLFQQVRNEAHRFAISFQRKKRVVK